MLDELPQGEAPPAFARRTRERAEQREAAGIRWLSPVVSVFGARRVRAAVAAVFLFAGLSAGAYMAWSTFHVDAAADVSRTARISQPVEEEANLLGTDLAAAPPGSLTRAYLAVAREPTSSE